MQTGCAMCEALQEVSKTLAEDVVRLRRNNGKLAIITYYTVVEGARKEEHWERLRTICACGSGAIQIIGLFRLVHFGHDSCPVDRPMPAEASDESCPQFPSSTIIYSKYLNHLLCRFEGELRG